MLYEVITNAFGYQILKDHIEEEFFPIAQAHQLRNFVKDSLKSLEDTYPQLFELLPRYLRYNYYVELFSLFKNELFDPFELNAQDFADFILERDESLPFFDASTDFSTRITSYNVCYTKLLRTPPAV